MQPTDEEVNRTLDQLSRTRMEIVDDADAAPRWQSDAEREGLPRSNQHDTKGAPLLDRDRILRDSYPNYARLK